jgi:hypothetical protein
VDKEFKERLADFFEADELVEYLVIPVEDIVEAFEDKILECLDDIEELMGIRRDNEQGALLDWESEEPSDT